MQLPKGVQAEFKKRISAASDAAASGGSSKKTKPKLNFANCELKDSQVRLNIALNIK
jgi:hypothetical protein